MVQLENEYGSYGLQTSHCDIEYMTYLRELVRLHLGPDVLMYTTGMATLIQIFKNFQFSDKKNYK